MIRISHHRYPLDRGIWVNQPSILHGAYWFLETNWSWLHRLAGWKHPPAGIVIGASIAYWRVHVGRGLRHLMGAPYRQMLRAIPTCTLWRRDHARSTWTFRPWPHLVVTDEQRAGA